LECEGLPSLAKAHCPRNGSHTKFQTMNELHITRVIHAPRPLVFQAWAEPGHLQNWYAPEGCSLEIRAIDVRPGGGFLTCIHNPQLNFDCWVKGVYLDVTPPERLVYTMRVCDEAGNSLSSAASGHDSAWPEETTLTVTFTEEGKATRIDLHQNVSEALAKQTGAYPSWEQMLDRLEALAKTI
jgi:uncharacterized protein YndB with AHSA1/START domain